MTDLDPVSLRQQFPLFDRQINGRRIVYLDSANTAQKPRQVIEAMDRFVRTSYAPINRSAYELAVEATTTYEAARQAARRLINANRSSEIVFVKGATEALNVVARSWGSTLPAGAVIVLTHMEHHANIVPWQMLAAERGLELRWVPLTTDGQLDLSDLDSLLEGASAFAFTAMSNVLGTINPVAELCRAAHHAGATAIVDACQLVPHHPADVQAWDADFVAFSSHKMCGPTGIGVLWGRQSLLEAMPPFLGGGNMIADVRLDGFTAAPVPEKFEAGTPAIIEAAGFLAAVEFIESVGLQRIHAHEVAMSRYFLDTMHERFGERMVIHGTTDVDRRGATFSFTFGDVHPHDLSQVLDQHNVCVRAGHHCAKPLMKLLGVNATVRASAYLYNDPSDIDVLADALAGASDLFSF